MLVVLVAACNYYAPGAFADDEGAFAGARATVGCIDVAVSLSYDRHGVGPVVGFDFGNRCSHEVLVDFTSVRVFAERLGVRWQLQPYDPQSEIEPTYLDRAQVGHEKILYPERGAFDRVCVDLGAVGGDAAAKRWVCIAA